MRHYTVELAAGIAELPVPRVFIDDGIASGGTGFRRWPASCANWGRRSRPSSRPGAGSPADAQRVQPQGDRPPARHVRGHDPPAGGLDLRQGQPQRAACRRDHVGHRQRGRNSTWRWHQPPGTRPRRRWAIGSASCRSSAVSGSSCATVWLPGPAWAAWPRGPGRYQGLECPEGGGAAAAGARSEREDRLADAPDRQRELPGRGQRRRAERT